MVIFGISVLILLSLSKTVYQKVGKDKGVMALFCMTGFILITILLSYLTADKIKTNTIIPYKQVSLVIYSTSNNLTTIKSNKEIVDSIHNIDTMYKSTLQCLHIKKIKYDSSKHSFLLTPFPVLQMQNLINRTKYRIE